MKIVQRLILLVREASASGQWVPYAVRAAEQPATEPARLLDLSLDLAGSGVQQYVR